jgi:hypothetical protein
LIADAAIDLGSPPGLNIGQQSIRGRELHRDCLDTHHSNFEQESERSVIAEADDRVDPPGLVLPASTREEHPNRLKELQVVSDVNSELQVISDLKNF